MKVSTVSYLAEYIGTFFFVLSVFLSGGNPLIIGGALALVIYVIAGMSGGHLNPTISISMYMNGALQPMELFSYVFAQLLGGVSAYYAFKISK